MFEQLVAQIFGACVYILQVIGGTPGEFGHGYYLANLLIFVFFAARADTAFLCAVEKGT